MSSRLHASNSASPVRLHGHHAKHVSGRRAVNNLWLPSQHRRRIHPRLATVFQIPPIPGGSMSLNSLEALFVNELKDIYNAEKQLVRALPRMAKRASSPQLQGAFKKHLKETENQ